MSLYGPTPIFDEVAAAILGHLSDLTDEDKVKVLSVLIDVLETHEWIYPQDSDYFENPLVQKIFREKHPEWFEEV